MTRLTTGGLLLATLMMLAACAGPAGEPLVLSDTTGLSPPPATTSSAPPTVPTSTTTRAPATVGDAGIETVQSLSQIDTVDGEWWIDGFGGLDAGRTYVSLGPPAERTMGESSRCPDAGWIDERDGLEGVIELGEAGSVATAYRLFAAFETDNLLGKPACMFIEGSYEGVAGEVAGTSGTFTIEWGTRFPDQTLVFDAG